MSLLSSCTENRGQAEVSIVKDGDRSVAIFIPSDLVEKVNDAELANQIIIRLSGSRDNMLGNFAQDNYGILFTPLIEMMPGNSYEIIYKGKVLSELTIPQKTTDHHISLQTIYPTADTLPENLLKVYLVFSEPMRQGVSERYIAILNANGDTLHNVFLNLNTELWDEAGKELTIWLDPGRIKRGLQPNEKTGNPLKTGNGYTLLVSPDWPDLKSNKLGRKYTKNFVAISRDIVSPDPAMWEMNIPSAGSRQALSISFNESMDYSLIRNSVSVIQRDGTTIVGKIFIGNREGSLLFYPEKHWAAGTYYLKVDSRLEDLAGNNLNRLFDRDVLRGKPAGTDPFFTRQFVIE